MVRLAANVVLDATSTSAQSLLTPPPGMKVVITQILFRDASASINAATTVSIGANGTSTALASASTVLQSMAAGNAVRAVVTQGTSSQVYALPGNDVTVTFGGTLTSNGSVKCDVIGYLTAG